MDDESLERVLAELIHSSHSLKHGAIHKYRPRFALSLRYLPIISSASAVDQCLSKALQVLSVILTHSLRLNKFLELKVQFWRYVLDSAMIHGNSRFGREFLDDVEDWIWMAEDESFPMFDLDMDLKGVNANASMEALFEFMTTLPESELDDRFASEGQTTFAPNKIGIGLNFSHCKLTPEYLLRI